MAFIISLYDGIVRVRLKFCLGIALLVWSAMPVSISAAAPSARVPRFEYYRVSGVYQGESIPPQFGNLSQYEGAELRCLGGDADYSREHANFAGHFVVESCTCGTGCYFLFMWDALNGKLFYREIPFHAINVGPYSESGRPSPAIVYRGEQYRLDSTLLIVEGCLGEACDCATRYYRWNGSQFQLILKQPVRMPLGCLKQK
jgi:hypothetical protein